MYNAQEVKAAYSGLVGLLQPSLPQTPRILAPLTTSESGIYAQDKHPLVSIDNLFYACPDFNSNNWNVWVSGSDYVIGDQRSYQGKIYKAIEDITGGTTAPPLDATNWELFNPFQDWLQQKVNQSITNMFSEVIRRKKLLGMAKALIDKSELYRGSGFLNKTIISEDAFVGFAIYLQPGDGILCALERVGIQSTQVQDALRYYLFHSSVEDAIGYWDVEIENENTFSWSDLRSSTSPFDYNCYLNYGAQNTEGQFYFGYYQSDLVGNAVSKDWDCQRVPCMGCDSSDLYLFNRWSRYTTFRNIKVPSTAISQKGKMFDKSKIIYDSITNWGINIAMTVRCDLTSLIIETKMQYADALAMQMAKEFLSSIAMNSRINPTNNQIQMQARSELDLKFPGSWIKSYNDSIDALNVDLTGFSKACYPCDPNKKVKFRMI